MKTQHTRILLLILGALIIGLSLYCFNKYLTSNTEPFYNYQAINPGDPLSTNIEDINIKNESGIISATSNPLTDRTYIIYNNQENGNKELCFYNPTTGYRSCIQADVNNVPIPTATLAPSIDNIRCRNNNEGHLLSANSKTIFYYNQNINNQKKVNCIYYSKLINNIPQLLCLPLPAISLSNTSPQTTNTEGRTNLSYDKLRFISANDKIILAMGCSNTLYYYPLADGLPTDNNANIWKVISSGSMPVNNSIIVDIKLNETTAFLYSRERLQPALNKLMFAPINMDGNTLNLTWTTWIPISDDNRTYQSMLLNGNTFTVNNNVLWFASSILSGSSNEFDLWWANLVNGAPKLNNNNGIPASTWQKISLGNMFSSIKDICIYRNFLVIYTANQNFLIELKPTATPRPTPTGTPSATPTATGFGTGSGSGSDSDSGTGSGSGTGTGTGTGTGIGSGTGSSGANTIFGTEVGSNASLNGIGNITTTKPMTTKQMTTTNPITTKPGAKLLGDEYKVDPGSISGMFGISGNTNNHDNLNDFLANTNLVGNNLYISPMNNQELYNPKQPKINGKISSSFFPMIRLE